MQISGHIGDVQLDGRGFLAPTCGVLNLPMRLAFRRFGAAMTYVGVIDAAAVARRGEPTLVNVLGRVETTCEREGPVAIQLIGSDPRCMADAAALVEPLADVIDVNFSGPVQAVVEQGWGAAMLTEPDRMAEIVAAIVAGVQVPVTVKIRIGLQGRDIDVVNVAKTCEAAGASAITVHARAASEKYTGAAHWESIAAVKKHVGIPVIGNGAIGSAIDAKAMVDRTGCDFVMMCTGAFVNPLIFQEVDALLATNKPVRTNRSVGLVRFMREYYGLIRDLHSRTRRRAFRKAFRRFWALRSYMRKLQAGTVSFG